MGKRFYKPPRMVDYRALVVDFYFRRFFCFMTPEIMLEIFGYIGTAIVLLSFLMTDMKLMRIVNMTGGTISLIYAFFNNSMPVVVLNASIITINAIQLIRSYIKEKNEKAEVNSEDAIAYNKEEKKEENI